MKIQEMKRHPAKGTAPPKDSHEASQIVLGTNLLSTD